MKLLKKATIFSVLMLVLISGTATLAVDNRGEMSLSDFPPEVLSASAKENVEVASKIEDETQEKDLSQLPENVRQAAENAKKGIELTGFHTERERGRVIYEVEGIAENRCYEIEITLKGEVLEIEHCD